ncbi:uncharacterized protein DFL_003946 [Arthrobotrys flagrans]|uniref:Uncharacterized protein n=1 Tax=Arthrobotrys flagrans TaxID=97331 RepID=A0A437A396_ARTFL|nr:hypothetical protein DFL_003946 [Arthrobotrys flagrans]
MSAEEYRSSPFYPADQESLRTRRNANDPFGEKDIQAIGDDYKNTVHWPNKNEKMKEKRLLRMKEVLEQEFRDEGVDMELTLQDVDDLLEHKKIVARAEERKKAEEARRTLPIYEAKSGTHVANATGIGGILKGGGRGNVPMRRATAGRPGRGRLQALPAGSQVSPPGSRPSGGERENSLLPS